MRILALQGSPRPQGNTQTVLSAVLEGAAEANVRTETIHLASLRQLTGCRECFTCQQTPDGPGCPVQDDMYDVLNKALKADVLIWATPVFCWTVAWPLKLAMDRFFCMFKLGADQNLTKCLLAGRKMAAVITAGGDETDGADLVTETCRRFAEYGQITWLGTFIATAVKTPEGILANTGLIERARNFGRRLAAG